MDASNRHEVSLATLKLREIRHTDNAKIAEVIRSVLIEMDAPRVGSAYADPSLDTMTEHYAQQARASYFVAELDGEVIAGCGFGPLPGEGDHLCELQKMYLLPACRGLGIGQQLVRLCIEKARSFGYTQCYLETLPNMLAAQALYQKMGFRYIDQALGNTGHNACPVWMLLDFDVLTQSKT